MGWLRDKFLGFLENMGSKLNGWAWDKRWKKRDHLRFVSQKTGKIYTINKKTGSHK
jgi:hypothetical protein